MSTDNKSGEREAVAWRYRDAWGNWAYCQAIDNDVGPTVITEKQALFSLSQLEAVERDRDANAKDRDLYRGMIISREALEAHGIPATDAAVRVAVQFRKSEVAAIARADIAEAQVTSLQQQVAELKGALEPFADVAVHDIGEDEADADVFRPMSRHNKAALITVGHLRAARTLTREAPNE